MANPPNCSTSQPSEQQGSTGFKSPPIGFFYYHLHEAIRRELESLWEVVLKLEGSCQEELQCRLAHVEEKCIFLQQIYKYHSVAEDEVVYPALDSKVKNVTLQYTVEHADEEHLFAQLLQMLRDALLQPGPQCLNVVRELVCKVEEVRFTLTKHLAKEEKQLFPLLQQHFSYTEQAELVAQFLCCIPLAAVERILMWLKPMIPQEEQDQLIDFIQLAIPDDMLLTLLVTWLSPVSPPKRQLSPKPSMNPDMLDHPPLDLIVHVHKSITEALSHFVSEARLLLLQGANAVKLSSLVEKHRFLRAVCRFHMLSEEEVMFPELDRQSVHRQCYSACQAEHVEETVWFEDLGRLLADVRSSVRRGSKEVSELLDKVIQHAELVSKNVGQHMEKEEKEVFPILQESLCVAEQCIMVWRTMTMMPLRLLQRVLPWLACGLSDNKTSELLAALCIGSSDGDAAAVELLTRWIQKGALPGPDNDILADKLETKSGPKTLSDPSCPDGLSQKHKRRRVSEDVSGLASSDDNGHKSCSGGSVGIFGPLPTLAKQSMGPSPIDHIFQIHRALKRDFRLFEAEAGELVQLLEKGEKDWNKPVKGLTGRFQFLRSIYIAHSSTEDEVVFPALESKEWLRNISKSYMLDHKQEGELFNDMQRAISQLQTVKDPKEMLKLAIQFSRKCAAVRASIETHVRAEENELWPLFVEHFDVEEQHKLVGVIVGRTGAEVMQTMLKWVSGCITPEEVETMMESVRTASRKTRFDKWLDAIGGRIDQSGTEGGGESTTVLSGPNVQEPLEEVARYLRSRGLQVSSSPEPHGTVAESSDFRPGWEQIFRMNQNQLEAAVRCVSSDDSLEPSRKSYITQSIMVSKYIIAQQQHAAVCENDQTGTASQDKSTGDGSKEVSTSYRTYSCETDGILGCSHYRRNCALVAPCCSKVFTCRFCHDEKSDHKIERGQISEMVCMICGTRQPIAASCSSCKKSMAHYHCGICRLFDDDPTHNIYHCQFCNVCRRGKGLGIDFFHCMECNACMHMSMFNRHKCREKSIECNCPVCNEGLFDSSQPIKELPCGHFLHSHCFSAYSQWNYTCPICSKSIGDMSAYFQMLDSLLASQPMPPELQGIKQNIICNDCSERSEVMYHYVYHACGKCHSYNTRVL